MQTLIILAGYIVYFIFIMVYVSQTCDVNEYLSNENYRRDVLNRIDTPVILGLVVAIILCVAL